VCQPPADLSAAEAEFWQYYAPTLAAAGRLNPEVRDTLAKYCTVLTIVANLRQQLGSLAPMDAGGQSAFRKELRQWLSLSRLYETDLLLNPASSTRTPKLDTWGTEPDPFAEFDQPPAFTGTGRR
jgi:phage terminase small subunit